MHLITEFIVFRLRDHIDRLRPVGGTDLGGIAIEREAKVRFNRAILPGLQRFIANNVRVKPLSLGDKTPGQFTPQPSKQPSRHRLIRPAIKPFPSRIPSRRPRPISAQGLRIRNSNLQLGYSSLK